MLGRLSCVTDVCFPERDWKPVYISSRGWLHLGKQFLRVKPPNKRLDSYGDEQPGTKNTQTEAGSRPSRDVRMGLPYILQGAVIV